MFDINESELIFTEFEYEMDGDFTPIIKSEKIMGEIIVAFEEYFTIVENIGSFKVFRNKEKKCYLFIGSEMISYSQEFDWESSSDWTELKIFGEIITLINKYISEKQIDYELQIRGNAIVILPGMIIDKADELIKEKVVCFDKFNLAHLGFISENKEYRFGIQSVIIKNEGEEEIEGHLIDFYRVLKTEHRKTRKPEQIIEDTFNFFREKMIFEMR